MDINVKILNNLFFAYQAKMNKCLSHKKNHVICLVLKRFTFVSFKVILAIFSIFYLIYTNHMIAIVQDLN